MEVKETNPCLAGIHNKREDLIISIFYNTVLQHSEPFLSLLT